ncbi:hypothetical protein BASA83_000359 [Batrachochytrium salamandrivorans]|nr:hypothetical protein BASA81_015202 [Batrachochytrium salamandrivorans]KAH9276848.1 hypothetical protein BASA83_000359 [Batrachochytrium salamandrivorans]
MLSLRIHSTTQPSALNRLLPSMHAVRQSVISRVPALRTIPVSALSTLSPLSSIHPPNGPVPPSSSSSSSSENHRSAAATDPFGTSVTRPYKTKTTKELVNSLAVFGMCAMPGLVSATPVIMSAAHSLGLDAPMHAIVKATFFKHFCGGENLNEVLPTMASFETAGIGSILDLAIEADLDAMPLTGEAARNHAKTMVADMKQSIDIAAHQPDSFIAAKVTALFSPVLLQRWTNTLLLLKAAFNSHQTDGRIDVHQFGSLATSFPGLAGKTTDLFASMDSDRDNSIDWTDMAAQFSLHNVASARLLLLDPHTSTASPNTQLVTADDLDTAEMVMAEVNSLCDYALLKRVKLMMDAEQTYFQPAIDDVILGLCSKWNPSTLAAASSETPVLGGPLIFNTYQMYLRDAYPRLEADTLRAARLGYSFGVKLVRGAYMVSERERAVRLGLEDPIQPTIADTHANYNRAIAFLIGKMTPSTSERKVKPVSLVVASHNKNSVRIATGLMNQHGVPSNDGSVAFGQLMGMQDGTGYALASHGFKSYKYIPYGPIEVTVPYLQRRAQENSSVLGGVGEDRRNVLSELKIRLGLLRVD